MQVHDGRQVDEGMQWRLYQVDATGTGNGTGNDPYSGVITKANYVLRHGKVHQQVILTFSPLFLLSFTIFRNANHDYFVFSFSITQISIHQKYFFKNPQTELQLKINLNTYLNAGYLHIYMVH